MASLLRPEDRLEFGNLAMDHSDASREDLHPLQVHDAPTWKQSVSVEEPDVEPRITVEDALEAIGYGRFQLGMITYAGLAWLADAAEMILLSFIGPAAKCEWKLTSTQEGAISSVVFVGIFCGSYLWGLIADLKGRKMGFLATVVFTLLFGLLSAWSPTFLWLLVARGLVGFGLGGSAVVFNLCLEFLPPSERGFWLVALEFFWTAGSVAEALLAWLILPTFNWRLLVALSSLPFLLLVIFYHALPESPRYLMVKGDTEGALAVLRRVAQVNGREMPTGSLILARTDPSTINRDSLPQVAENRQLITKESPKSARLGAWDTYKAMFSPQLRKTTILLWLNYFGNAFAYYGLVLLTTQLSSGDQQCQGDAKVSQFCSADGRTNIDSWTYKEVLLSSFAELPGLVIACLAIERLGRKRTLVALLIGCAAFLSPLLTTTSTISTMVLLFGARACIMGAFSVLWVFAPELYPTNIRASALGFANAGSRIGGFLCPFAAVGLVENCHKALAVGLFSGVSLLSGVVSLFFPVETKGLGLSDDFR